MTDEEKTLAEIREHVEQHQNSHVIHVWAMAFRKMVDTEEARIALALVGAEIAAQPDLTEGE